MRITLKLPILVLCFVFVFSALPTKAPAAAGDEAIVIAGCNAGELDCSKPKSSKSDSKKKPSKGKKKS